MAALNRPKTDRGQLMLATGLMIAVVLVSLIVLLNTVIYTENLATRGVDAGGADALEYRATVVGSVGELVDEENEHFDEGPPPTVAVATGTGTVTDALTERHLTRGAVAESGLKGGEDGITTGSPIVWQDEDRAFTSNDGSPDWTVATDVSELEGFVLTVTPAELIDADTEPFRVVLDDWSMEIDVIEIEVDNGGEEPTMEERIEVTVDSEEEEASTYLYGYEESPLEIKLVEGSVETDGGSEDDIEPPTLDGNELRFENGDRATGTFEIRSNGTPNEDGLTEHRGTDAGVPFYTYLVESVDLAIHYETAELRYTTEATVMAGESA